MPGCYSEITGRETPLNPLPHSLTTWFWVTVTDFWLHMLPSWAIVQSLLSARSQEEFLVLSLSSELGEKETEKDEEEEGCCYGRRSRPATGAHTVPWNADGEPCTMLCYALCPTAQQLFQCPMPLPHLHTATRLACACLFSGLTFYHPVSSYLCPLLKADLFISESLPVLCPSLHLLVNLLHLLSSWHKVFVKAFLIPLNPLG